MNPEFRILVVDDEKEYQDVYKMILEDEGYSVDTASSGTEALSILGKNSYNLVLADLIMEGMNCITLLKKIKE